LCKKVVWLADGKVHKEGASEFIIGQYLNNDANSSGEVIFSDELQGIKFNFKRLTLLNSENEVTSVFDVRNPIRIQLEYEAKQAMNNLEISLRVYNSSGVPIFTTNRSSNLPMSLKATRYIAEIEIPPQFLSPSTYNVTIAAHIPNVEVLTEYQSIISFDIKETGSKMSIYQGASFGVVMIDCPWKEVSII
jgi:hypothetical protein